MLKVNIGAFDPSLTRFLRHLPSPRSFTQAVGRKLFFALLTAQGLGAFALITLGVLVKKPLAARAVVRPMMWREVMRSGVRLLSMFFFVSLALGFLVIGQAVPWLLKAGRMDVLGDIMVIVIVRELGPLLTALLVLTRVGTANVVELGMARATGEVEALEALGIDPVHFLVVPRLIGLAVGVFALTVYLILGALLSGYLWAFLRNVPLLPGDYFKELAGSLTYMDFVLLGLKTVGFGIIIAIVTCYHGLAQPLRLEEVSRATVRAVAQTVICCVLLDALFIICYLAVS